uniref:Uncharacterized protein n=1 Tax=Romanomermis culicivorax TaxID=13658 RepID=A0A915JJY9_ROMCU
MFLSNYFVMKNDETNQQQCGSRFDSCKEKKFHDQVENSSSNDNNEKLAIKQKVDILEKRVEMVERKACCLAF